RVDEVERVSHEMAAARAVHIRHKVNEVVSLPVAIGVPAADDPSHALLFAQGTVLVRRDVDIPVGRGRDGRRIIRVWRSGELADLETFRKSIHATYCSNKCQIWQIWTSVMHGQGQYAPNPGISQAH